MKKTQKFAAIVAVGLMALGTSAFADSRHRNETDDAWRTDVRSNDQRRGRDAQRSVTMQGRVRSVDRDRDGYRVQLDRAQHSFYVPHSALRHRNGRNINLRVGVNIRFTGVYDPRGYVYVSSADWIDDDYWYEDDRRGSQRYGYHDREYVRGVVERVEAHRGKLLLRDDRSGRRVTVVMVGGSRNRRGVDLNDLRRGDFVTLAGDWHRGGLFEAYRIESVRSGRW